MAIASLQTCTGCGKEFLWSPSKDRNGNICKNRYCSRDCYHEYRATYTASGKLRKTSLLRTCKGCGADFFVINENSTKKHCSEQCWKAHKKAKPKNCVGCGCLFTPVKFHHTGRMISHNAGKTCSHACYIMNIKTDEVRKKKISLAFTGEKHPLWKGGTSYFGTLSSRGPNWKSQRKLALKRDKYICQNCGIDNDSCKEKYGRTLDVDHIIPYHQHTSYKKANRLNNLITLCASCHRHLEAKKEGSQMVLPIMEHGGNHSGYARGEKINTAKLKEFQVLQIRKLADSGMIFPDIAEIYKITSHHVSLIVRGTIWKHLPLGTTAGVSRRGTVKHPKGEECGSAKLTNAIVMEMRQRASTGEPLVKIAESMSVSYYRVHQIVSGRSWKHLPIMGYKLNRRIFLGEQQGGSKVKNADVIEMRRRYESGETIASIAKDYPLSDVAVGNILKGKTWKHLPILGRPEKRGEA